MKVGVIGKTSRIVSIIQHIKGVTDTQFSMDGKNVGICDVLLLDHVSAIELESYSNEYAKHNVAFIVDIRNGLRSDYEKIKELCTLKGIPFLVDRSDQGIQEEVEKFLFPQRYEGRLQPALSLIACHRKSGVCLISEALSERIAQRTSAHIGLIKLDPYNVTSHSQGLNQLYREFEAGGLSSGRIKELAEAKRDNLFYIAGNPKMDYARGFHPHKLEQIYGLIQAAFDITIFIVYPYWDNSMTLVALKQIKRKYLIATSKREEMKEFYAFVPQIRYQFDLDLRHNSFIYNFDGYGNEAKLSVSDHLQAGCVLQLPYVPGPNPMAQKFTQAGLQRLAETIVNDYGLPVIQQAEKKTWLNRITAGLQDKQEKRLG